MRKRIISAALVLSLVAGLLSGCGSDSGKTANSDWRELEQNVIDDKYRTFYEIFLYSYCDSDGDGIGDINGLISKLDYLNDGDPSTTDDLGVNGIWLMPIMQSPSYHKYDTVDYMSIDADYGTKEDFEKLLEECHKRGINVIIDLAMNHSSNQHPWFQNAYAYMQTLEEGQEPSAEDCKYYSYYNFTKESAGGFTQVEGTDWYYESRFVDSMPDLNLLNPQVQKEFEYIADFWLGLGVDGFRLDAVKYFEFGDTEACIDTLSWFNDYVKGINSDAYIVCECWDSQNEYAKYYASGVDSLFDFAFADKSGIIKNTASGINAASGYVNALVSEEELYSSYSDTYINAPFYTNHDMARSAGFYPGEDGEKKVKLAQALNLLMPGNCFIYYGEELGMKGSGIDENKRAPMQWSSDASAEGMCKGPANMEDFEMKFGSLEEQKDSSTSIYSYVKDVILLRNQNPEIARGKTENIESLSGENTGALRRIYEDSEIVLIFSTSEETVTLDISTLGEGYSIVGDLEASEGKASLEGTSLSLPSYGLVALKK